MKLENNESNVIGVTSKEGFFTFWCGGCRNAHPVYTTPDVNGNCYTFNNNLLHPTFKFVPSQAGIYVFAETKPCGEPNADLSYCRFEITDGIITYDKSCSHILAGMAVEMRPRSEWGGIKFKPDIDEAGDETYKAEFEQ